MIDCAIKLVVVLYAGKVYNITAYMEFHPGEIPELMRGAGKDCTQLFDEVSKPVVFLCSCY